MIIFNAHHPWCKHELEAGTVFTTASIEEKSCLELLSKLNNCPESDIVKNVNEWLEGAVNHFAIICKFAGGIVAAADRTASYPVYISKADAEIKISNHARSLVSDMSSQKMDADGNGFLSKEEIKKVMEENSKTWGHVDDETFDQVDLNDDGKISIDGNFSLKKNLQVLFFHFFL